MALTIALFILLKIAFSFSLNTILFFHTVLLILCNNDKLYFSSLGETYFQAITLQSPHSLNRTQPIVTLAVTVTSQPSLEFSWSSNKIHSLSPLHHTTS